MLADGVSIRVLMELLWPWLLFPSSNCACCSGEVLAAVRGLSTVAVLVFDLAPELAWISAYLHCRPTTLQLPHCGLVSSH